MSADRRRLAAELDARAAAEPGFPLAALRAALHLGDVLPPLDMSPEALLDRLRRCAELSHACVRLRDAQAVTPGSASGPPHPTQPPPATSAAASPAGGDPTR